MRSQVQVTYFQVAPRRISEGAEEAGRRSDETRHECDFMQVLQKEVPACSRKELWAINGTSKVRNPQATPSHWLGATGAHGLL